MSSSTQASASDSTTSSSCQTGTTVMVEQQGLHFSISPSTLRNQSRLPCSKCKRRRAYFCYDCLLPMGDPTSIPRVSLPLRVVIVQHERELRSKSTATHAAILAPDHVIIHTYPNIPVDLLDPETAVLVYPDSKALSISEITEQERRKHEQQQQQQIGSSGEVDENAPQKGKEAHSTPHISKKEISTVVFIDSTWKQSKSIFRDPRLQALQTVMIKSEKTRFWRYQQFGDTYLSTIEAIYFFFREWWPIALMKQNSSLQQRSLTTIVEPYSGQYDDLLFYYEFLRDRIQVEYDPEDSMHERPDENAPPPKRSRKLPHTFRQRQQQQLQENSDDAATSADQ